MFDSHCHIDFSEFDENRAEYLQQAMENGVTQMMIPGVDIQSLERFKAIHLSSSIQFYYALGIHPYFLKDFKNEHIHIIEQQLYENDLVIHAIGESGLDASVDDIQLQTQLLHQHFNWAQRFQLPIVLHHRQTQASLFKIAKQYGGVTGVIHAFSGSIEQAQQWIDLGYCLGAGGTITYERANKTRNTFAKIPLQAIVLETDAPSMPIFGQQGKINHPKNLLQIAQTLADLKQLPLQEIQQQTTDNAELLFNVRR